MMTETIYHVANRKATIQICVFIGLVSFFSYLPLLHHHSRMTLYRIDTRIHPTQCHLCLSDRLAPDNIRLSECMLGLLTLFQTNIYPSLFAFLPYRQSTFLVPQMCNICYTKSRPLPSQEALQPSLVFLSFLFPHCALFCTISYTIARDACEYIKLEMDLKFPSHTHMLLLHNLHMMILTFLSTLDRTFSHLLGRVI